MQLRILESSDAKAFQALRLAALQECPTAFSSSYEEECETSLTVVAERLAPTEASCVIAAHEQGQLVAMVGVQREKQRKLRHKAYLWGVYVTPSNRRSGVGRKLILAAIERAAAMPEIRQINLSVNAANTAGRKLYEATGFQSFGLEKGFLMLDGVLHDEAHMVLHVERA